MSLQPSLDCDRGLQSHTAVVLQCRVSIQHLHSLLNTRVNPRWWPGVSLSAVD